VSLANVVGCCPKTTPNPAGVAIAVFWWDILGSARSKIMEAKRTAAECGHLGVKGGRMGERLSYEDMAAIVDAHADALLLFARQWSDATAADVVQEAFLQLVRRVQANDPPKNVVAWLYRVVRNELITQYHASQRARAREERVAAERPEWFEPALDTRLDAMRAAELLHTLPVEQRETVVARIWGGLSFDEIADLTRTSRSTAHRRYLTAIETLRQGLCESEE
jgi:RNA polymerase sigma factor (sigma-70 family)